MGASPATRVSRTTVDGFLQRLETACAAADQWPRKVGATIAAALDSASTQPARRRHYPAAALPS